MSDTDINMRLQHILVLLETHDRALRVFSSKLERIELMLIEIRENTRRATGVFHGEYRE